MRIRIAMPDEAVNEHTLDSALEAVTRVDEQLIGQGAVPLAAQAIHDGLRWSPEPVGEERFDHAGILIPRGWGDCDDLAPYHAASLRVTGIDRGARARVVRTGPDMWHALVQRSNGQIDDPSLWAGMPMPHPTRAPVAHALNGGHPAVAAVHRIGAWYARADLPWHGTPFALAGYGAGECAEDAVEKAIVGVCGVGTMAGIAHPDHVNHLFEGMRKRGWGAAQGYARPNPTEGRGGGGHR